LEGIRKAPGESYVSLGLGQNIQFQDTFVSGAALAHEGTVMNLSAFSRKGHKNDTILTQRRKGR
jgi:hypothetical protein